MEPRSSWRSRSCGASWTTRRGWPGRPQLFHVPEFNSRPHVTLHPAQHERPLCPLHASDSPREPDPAPGLRWTWLTEPRRHRGLRHCDWTSHLRPAVDHQPGLAAWPHRFDGSGDERRWPSATANSALWCHRRPRNPHGPGLGGPTHLDTHERLLVCRSQEPDASDRSTLRERTIRARERPADGLHPGRPPAAGRARLERLR